MNDTVVRVEGGPALRSGACQVIAEAGANHNNSVDRAIELAKRAADAGAWAVKYQLYKASSIAIRNSPKYWTDGFGTSSQYEAFERSAKLDYCAFRDVADACREAGILFFATPFDFEAVEALEALDAPLYKIASGDITHRPLLQAVAQTGKPILLSTGAATADEVEDALGWLGVGPDRLVLLVCTLTYPTPDGDGNFGRIETFRQRFHPYLIGMSDHTLGPEGGWMTAALGGVCIEKHYTLDKTLPDVPDHAMSVDPAELAALVQAAARGAVLRGSSGIGVRASEEPARASARRSIVAAASLEAGRMVQIGDLAFKRPGAGLPPAAVDLVIGRVLARDVAADHVLTLDDLV